MRKIFGISKTKKEISSFDTPNSHILITGKSGTGKTYTIWNLIVQAVANNIPVVIIDVGNSFANNQIQVNVKSFMKDKLLIYDVADKPLPINPFFIDNIESKKNQKIIEIANRISDILKGCLKLGMQQRNEVYESIVYVFNSNDSITFKKVFDRLKEMKKNPAKTSAEKLLPLITGVSFSDKNDSLDSILYDNPKVHIFQISGLSDEVKKIVSDFILFSLMERLRQNGSIEKNFVLVLDELRNINCGDSAPLTKILTEGRKFGVECICATQFIRSKNTDFISILEQAATRVFFKPNDSEIKLVAKHLSNILREDWESILKTMPRGYCIIDRGLIADCKEDMAVKVYKNEEILNKYMKNMCN